MESVSINIKVIRDLNCYLIIRNLDNIKIINNYLKDKYLI